MDSPQCHLIYFSGSRAGEAEAFQSARISIGRAANSDFRVHAAYDDVAQHHAEILFEDGTFVLYDLGAKSGTFVNGDRVKERRPLKTEDYLKFGKDGLEVIFRVGTPAPGYQPIPTLTADDAQIQFISGSDAGRLFVVSGSSVTRIGRRQELEICLDPRGDMIVSGNHCSISFQDGAWVLTDTSRNGTYVNNELVDGSIELRDGDVIMLGDGGPQGRFRSQSAGVHYPNVERMESAAAAFAHQELEQPESGATELPSQETPSPEVPESFRDATPAIAAVAAAGAGTATGAQSAFPAAAIPQPTAPTGSNLRGGLGSRKLRWILGAAGVLLLVVAVTALVLPGKETVAPAPPRSEPVDYGKALESTSAMENQAGSYQVQVPANWRTRESGALLSMESPDREVAIDYVRHLGLNERALEDLLGRGTAPVVKVGNSTKAQVEQSAFVSRSGGTARIGVLHQPPQGVPALAMLETSEATLPRITEATIQKLLIDNVKLNQVPGYEPPPPVVQATPAPIAAPATAPTPAPTVVASATQPPSTPGSALPPTPEPAAEPVQTAAPTPNTTPPPATTPNVTPAATPDAPPTGGNTVRSEGLGITLDLPQGWAGTVNEEDGIIEIAADDGMSVRLARDPDAMQMEEVLEAMKAEGWEEAGVKAKNTFAAAELGREDERLLLVLVPAKPQGTDIIYATRKGSFTPEQRDGIVQLVQQLR